MIFRLELITKRLSNELVDYNYKEIAKLILILLNTVIAVAANKVKAFLIQLIQCASADSIIIRLVICESESVK